MKEFMPISIDLYGREILIVGAGKQGAHKIELLLRFSKNIRIISRDFSEKALNLIKENNLKYKKTPYKKRFLKGAYIVYACTDSRDLNRTILKDGHKKNLLVNVADDPKLCDFVSPAIYIEDNMRVAVSSNGKDVLKSIKWRNILREFILSDKFRDKEQR